VTLATKTETDTGANVERAVPFLLVMDIAKSLRFYVEGIGFRKTKEWVPEGQLRWCWLELDGVAVMLQEFRKGHVPAGKLGEGVSICFQCRDALALYRQFTSRGLEVQEPFVGNGMWVTVLADPDGYKLDFESHTDAPEEITLGKWEGKIGA